MINKENFRDYKDNYYKVANILNSKFNKIIKLSDYPKNVKILLLANKINPILYKKIINNI